MGAQQSAPTNQPQITYPPQTTCPPEKMCPPQMTCAPEKMCPVCPPQTICPTMFGVNYKAVDALSGDLLNKVQNVINAVQPIMCQTFVPVYIDFLQRELETSSPGPQHAPPNEIKKQLRYMMSSAIKKGFADGMQPITQSTKDTLTTAIDELIDASVDAATVNGKVEHKMATQVLINVLKSLCPGGVGTYTRPAPTTPPIILFNKKKIDVKVETLQVWTGESQPYHDINILFDGYPTTNIPNKGGLLITTDDGLNKVEINFPIDKITKASGIDHIIKGSKNPTKINIKFVSTTLYHINRIQVTAVPSTSSINQTIKSTFANISRSNFGSSCGCWLWMVILFIVVVAVLVYLHSQGKLKMPTMSQRIAQFGSDIKSLRKIRR